MKTKAYIKIVFVGIVLVTWPDAYGFGNKGTHPALTQKAVLDSVLDHYLRTGLGIKGGIHSQSELAYDLDTYNAFIKMRMEKAGVENPGDPSRTIFEWIRAGSSIEDEDSSLLQSIRARHHFYDPTCNFEDFNEPARNAGLDNKTDHPGYSSMFAWLAGIYTDEFDVTGQSAKTWMMKGFAEQEPEINAQSWIDAKDNLDAALTIPYKSWREECLAMTFLDLGCVLHMIEDMGVPAHTRNDFLFAHYRPPASTGNPFESWVEKQVKANAGHWPWSGSGPVVFDKLAEYFDADEYVGDYLGDGISPPEGIWGLAECSNYQFLSLSTVFGCSGVKYQFPHPAKEHTVIQTETNKTYFDGYGVQHLARESYTHHMVSSVGFAYDLVDSTNTTDDAGVFEDYAGITIPRTIDYATGLINYFFRGRLTVRRGSADPNITTDLVITNTSNNSGIPQVLKGGTFEIYRDDVNETRTQVPPGDITFIPPWTSTSVLPNDAGLTELVAQFAATPEEARNYVVVYKGQISELPEDPDPDDPNAIAAGILRGGYEIFAWTDYPAIGDEFGQVSDAPEGADFIDIAAGMRHCLALRTDGSIEAWGRDNSGQVSGKPDGNDFVAIAGGRNHSLALKSDGSIVVWGDNSSNQITDKPSGSDFVAITAGDYHNLALKSDGSIIAWGRNSSNQCNVPDPEPGTVYTAIAAGSAHSLALQSDGMIKAWGSNAAGQTTIYPDVETDNKAIAACSNYNLLLRTDGVLKSWGGGDWEDPETRTIPRYHDRPADANDFVAIAAGADHILALTSDGRILAWEWPTGPFSFDSFSAAVPEGIVFTDDIAAGNKFSLGLKAP